MGGKRKLARGPDDDDDDNFGVDAPTKAAEVDIPTARANSVTKLKTAMEDIIHRYSNMPQLSDVVDLEAGRVVEDRGGLSAATKTSEFGAAITEFAVGAAPDEIPKPKARKKPRRTVDALVRGGLGGGLGTIRHHGDGELIGPGEGSGGEDGASAADADGTTGSGKAVTARATTVPKPPRPPGGVCNPAGCTKAYCFRCAAALTEDDEDDEDDDAAAAAADANPAEADPEQNHFGAVPPMAEDPGLAPSLKPAQPNLPAQPAQSASAQSAAPAVPVPVTVTAAQHRLVHTALRCLFTAARGDSTTVGALTAEIDRTMPGMLSAAEMDVVLEAMAEENTIMRVDGQIILI